MAKKIKAIPEVIDTPEVIKNNFNVKKYIPMSIKELIAEDVAKSYFVYDNEGNLVDYSEIDKMRTLVYRLFQYYTDIEIPIVEKEENESDEEFILRAWNNENVFIDSMMENGNYNKLLGEIWKEVQIIELAVESKISFKKKKIEDDNSFGKVFVKLIQTFLDKAPDTQQMSEIFEKFKDMDLNKMGDIMEIKKILS